MSSHASTYDKTLRSKVKAKLEVSFRDISAICGATPAACQSREPRGPGAATARCTRSAGLRKPTRIQSSAARVQGWSRSLQRLEHFLAHFTGAQNH